jgi:hypothetical protein
VATSEASIIVPRLSTSPARLQLARELAKQLLAQPRLDQAIAKAAQRRVIGRWCLERQADEPPERNPIVDSLFQIGIRQPIELLQKQRLEHQKGGNGGRPPP